MNHAVEIVVARYREDVSWIDSIGFPAVVYDKSGDTPIGERFLPLPNIGRETHTYLHHILDRWPDFPEYTIFLQGSPWDHLAAPDDEPYTPSRLKALIEQLVAKQARFKGLAWYAIQCDTLGRPHHLFDENSRGKWAGYGRDIPVGDVYEQLFSGPVPEKYTCRAPAGLLFVSRERLLSRPRGLYEAAMRLVEADPDDAGNTGHAMERLWYLIFNGNHRLNKDFPS